MRKEYAQAVKAAQDANLKSLTQGIPRVKTKAQAARDRKIALNRIKYSVNKMFAKYDDDL